MHGALVRRISAGLIIKESALTRHVQRIISVVIADAGGTVYLIVGKRNEPQASKIITMKPAMIAKLLIKIFCCRS